MNDERRLFSIYWGTASLKGNGIINLMASTHDEARQAVEHRMEIDWPQAYPKDASIWMVSESPVEPHGCVVCSALLERVPSDSVNGIKYRCTNPECGRALWFERLS